MQISRPHSDLLNQFSRVQESAVFFQAPQVIPVHIKIGKSLQPEFTERVSNRYISGDLKRAAPRPHYLIPPCPN